MSLSFGKYRLNETDIADSLCFAQYLILTAAEIATGESQRATRAKFTHKRLRHYPNEAGNSVEDGCAILEVTAELNVVVTGTHHARPRTITTGPFYIRAENGGPWHACRIVSTSLTIEERRFDKTSRFSISASDSPYWPEVNIWEQYDKERPDLKRHKAVGTHLTERKVFC